MAKGKGFCRHFRALARKNCINWRRTPVCSVLEILLAVVLMAGLVVFRHFVDTTSVDTQGMLDKKGPVYAALQWEETRLGGDWIADNKEGSAYVNGQQQEFMLYANKSCRADEQK